MRLSDLSGQRDIARYSAFARGVPESESGHGRALRNELNSLNRSIVEHFSAQRRFPVVYRYRERDRTEEIALRSFKVSELDFYAVRAYPKCADVVPGIRCHLDVQPVFVPIEFFVERLMYSHG